MTDLFVDFVCPYAWRGVELATVLRPGGEAFRLRFYSLVEGNHPDNAAALNWRVTEQPLGGEPQEGYMRFLQPSLGAFLAALAAAQQGDEAGWAFALSLFRAHHERKEALAEPAFVAAAQEAGLDLDRWHASRQDEAALRAALRAELDEAREIGVFGTPTYVLPGGETAYFRFENLTRDPQEAADWWQLYGTVLKSGAGIATIKRAKHRPAAKRG